MHGDKCGDVAKRLRSFCASIKNEVQIGCEDINKRKAQTVCVDSNKKEVQAGSGNGSINEVKTNCGNTDKNEAYDVLLKVIDRLTEQNKIDKEYLMQKIKELSL